MHESRTQWKRLVWLIQSASKQLLRLSKIMTKTAIKGVQEYGTL